MNYELAVNNIRGELKKYLQKTNLKSLVIGISGGIDSCLCAALARPVCDELGIALIGRSLPIKTNEEDELFRARETGEAFCTNFKEDRILEVYYDRMSSELNPQIDNQEMQKWKIRNGNMKARLRMTYLYNLASMNNGMVLSTDNLTEYLLGFWTLHGDVGDFGMIQNLWKTEVYNMAEWIADNYPNPSSNPKAINAIRTTIQAMATDGLGVTNLGDLGQILSDWRGTSREGYKEVDRVLQVWTSMHTLESTQKTILTLAYEKHPVIQRHLNSDFKRENPQNINRNLIWTTS
jgi:NAD+ synthetase